MLKRGSLLQTTIIHIILVALVLSLLLFAILGRGSVSIVKQELLEKQTALLIEVSPVETVLEIKKENTYGIINDIRILQNKIYIDMGSAISKNGYPFFSRYIVSIKNDEKQNKFIITISDTQDE
jgi:hypothetical protein